MVRSLRLSWLLTALLCMLVLAPAQAVTKTGSVNITWYTAPGYSTRSLRAMVKPYQTATRYVNIKNRPLYGLIVKDSYWRWPERNLAGNTIGFHVQVLGLSFHDAMRQITGT